MTGVPLHIRAETEEDVAAIHELNGQAFETDAEARLVDALRLAARPFVSWVAEREGEIVGHILFTRVTVETNPSGVATFGLGPMAVRPACQRQGVGSALVESGLHACREAGGEVVVVLGHPDYYPRFGFQPAAPRGLYYQSHDLDPYFMVRALTPGALEGLTGEVRYDPAFDSVD